MEALARRVRVALGEEPGDLLLTGGRVVNVFNRRVEDADVAIADGVIAGVGRFDWRAAHVIDLAGQTILPGLIDTHMHLESTLLTPAELARLIVPRGTTTVISDSHEIGNVLGVAGIDRLASAAEGLPIDLFFMASSCVPATSWEDAGASIGPDEVRALLDRPRVLGLAEMMDVPAVLAGDPNPLAKIEAARRLGLAVDGHAPGLAARSLMAYVAAGIRSDHESTNVDEARVKAALGMLVQVREGSPAQNLEALLPLLASGEIDESWCLVTDDVFPDDLLRLGHLDGLLRRVVAGGVPPGIAIRHASYVPARHYGLNDRGAVAPGFRADLAVVENLVGFEVRLVVKDGRVVARDGEAAEIDRVRPRLALENSIRVAPLDESAFRLRMRSASCPVIRIVPDQIVTGFEAAEVRVVDGTWEFDPGLDVVLIASIERHRASGLVGLGLVAGLGLTRHGAIGSSVAHDSHNLIVAGTNPRDMLACARALAEAGGGFVAVAGESRTLLPLPVAGLLSTEAAEVVCRQLGEVNAAARSLGCRLDAPFGTLSFLALPVIPEVRITARGPFDVRNQRFFSYG